jgi:prolyl oligopeptidase
MSSYLLDTTLDESAPARVFDVHRLPGGRYFYQKRLATEDVAKLYTRVGMEGEEKLLVDPTKLPAPQGSHNSISYYAVSFDGRYVAYGISPSGSEDAVLHIVETATARETGEAIDRAQFGSPAWAPDGQSLFYNRLQKPRPNAAPTDRYLKSRVYLHRVGMDAEKDRAVFGFDLSTGVSMTETDIPFVTTAPGSGYVLSVIEHGVQNELTIYAAAASVDQAQIPWRKICDVEDELPWMCRAAICIC